MAIDPICGMTVREDAARFFSDYAGLGAVGKEGPRGIAVKSTILLALGVFL